MTTYTQRNNQILEEVSTSLFVQKKKILPSSHCENSFKYTNHEREQKNNGMPLYWIGFFFFVFLFGGG